MRVGIHILLMCGMIDCDLMPAQTTGPAPQTQGRAAGKPSVPSPPLPKPPIAYFRHLLGLSPEELEKALAEKSEGTQKILRAKVHEYASLSPAQREARLKATELRWYLRPLMEQAPTHRVQSLATMPDELRSLVESRLQQWDLLTPDVQRKVLDNERFIDYFLRLESSAQDERNPLLQGVSPKGREELEKALVRWRTLPADKRQQMCDRFQQFFELPPDKKNKTLNALSEEERKQMDDTLQAFEKLPPAQRRLCVNSFRTLANMSPEERARFLKNAERWREMSPAERETWRRLVTQLPPSPPGLGEPPVPPSLPRRKSSTSAPPGPNPIGLTNAVQ